jgi:hypothetical protein
VDIDGRLSLRVPQVAENKTLWIESGFALTQFAPRPTDSDWARTTVEIPTAMVFLPTGKSIKDSWGNFTISSADITATASLASISNEGPAHGAGWAVDRCRARQDETGRVIVEADIAVRDIDGAVLRIAYTAIALGYERSIPSKTKAKDQVQTEEEVLAQPPKYKG